MVFKELTNETNGIKITYCGRKSLESLARLHFFSNGPWTMNCDPVCVYFIRFSNSNKLREYANKQNKFLFLLMIFLPFILVYYTAVRDVPVHFRLKRLIFELGATITKHIIVMFQCDDYNMHKNKIFFSRM